MEALDLSQLVLDMRELLVLTLAKKTQLEFELPSEDVVAGADSAQLNQVLLNVVLNGAEAVTNGRGRVRIATHIKATAADELRSEYIHEPLARGRYGVLEVSDNGVGVDADTQQYQFDPFYTTKFSGRGLGLSAVLGIVRTHHGTIQVQSAPGEGSTFRVFLPICAVPAPEARPVLLRRRRVRRAQQAWR